MPEKFIFSLIDIEFHRYYFSFLYQKIEIYWPGWVGLLATLAWELTIINHKSVKFSAEPLETSNTFPWFMEIANRNISINFRRRSPSNKNAP